MLCIVLLHSQPFDRGTCDSALLCYRDCSHLLLCCHYSFFPISEMNTPNSTPQRGISSQMLLVYYMVMQSLVLLVVSFK